MERHYEGSNILFLESRAQFMYLQVCISFFTIYSESNICEDLEYVRRVTVSVVGKWLARNINSPAHVQKIPFCKCLHKFHSELVETFIKSNFMLFKLS